MRMTNEAHSQHDNKDVTTRRWPQFSLRTAVLVAVEFQVIIALWSTIPMLRRIGFLDFWIFLSLPLFGYQLLTARHSWQGAIRVLFVSVWYVVLTGPLWRVFYPDEARASAILLVAAIAGAAITSWIVLRSFQGWQYVLVVPVWLAIILGTVHVFQTVL